MYPWLHLGPITISTYSVLFLCAFLVGGIMTYYEAKRQHRATEVILRVAIGALIGGVLGAKLSMLIFLGPTTFIKDLPYLWYSGQAWTGAFFGGYAGVLIVKRMNHINYSTGDIFAPALPLAQAIGRLGNLMGGDPFGLPSNLPWAITQYGVRRQPSALYELILDLLLFVIIMLLRDKMPRPGDLFKLYIVGYCSLRFVVDFTRADPRVIPGFTLVQVLYFFTIIAFAYQLIKSFRESRQTRKIPQGQTVDIR
ncbi:MAG TPA: prolipoprotein diacylglyceryl transferase family protein [Ktedonobacteraceae bacterium]|nr:prolipoprotein diacylglyceryl transferase family protein [Ktedonobacteraceae bacterium]